MSRRRCAGFTMLEAVIALAVVVLVAGTLLGGSPMSATASTAALRASAAHRLATSALEHVDVETLVPGTTTIDVDKRSSLPDAELERTVREIEARLLEVETVVRWREPGESERRETRIVTLLAQEPIR